MKTINVLCRFHRYFMSWYSSSYEVLYNNDRIQCTIIYQNTVRRNVLIVVTWYMRITVRVHDYVRAHVYTDAWVEHTTPTQVQCLSGLIFPYSILMTPCSSTVYLFTTMYMHMYALRHVLITYLMLCIRMCTYMVTSTLCVHTWICNTGNPIQIA